MSTESERIIGLYERHAGVWDRARGRSLFEKPWLDRFLALVPHGASILDIGCGSGEPIARYLIARGYAVTGVNSSAPLIEMCRERFPDGDWIVGDMRALDLQNQFSGLVAWDSFFPPHARGSEGNVLDLPQARCAWGLPHVHKWFVAR